MRLDVPVALQDVDDFQHIVPVAKENHVVLVWMAAQVGTQLRPLASDPERRRGKVATLRPQLAGEPLGDSAASAPVGDELGDGIEVVLGPPRCSAVVPLVGLPPALPRIETRIDAGRHLLVGVVAAPLD